MVSIGKISKFLGAIGFVSLIIYNASSHPIIDTKFINCPRTLVNGTIYQLKLSSMQGLGKANVSFVGNNISFSLNNKDFHDNLSFETNLIENCKDCDFYPIYFRPNASNLDFTINLECLYRPESLLFYCEISGSESFYCSYNKSSDTSYWNLII